MPDPDSKPPLSSIVLSLLYGSSVGHWLALLKRYGPADPGRHTVKAAITALVTCLFAPLLLLDRCLSKKMLSKQPGAGTQPARQMIFVVGFYRSGTSHVHRLLTCDPQNGFLDIVYCFFPKFALAGGKTLRRLVSLLLPADRGSDRMKLDVRFPEEDEYALCNSSMSGLYHATFFPRAWNRIYEHNMFDDGKDPVGEKKWLAAYAKILDRGLAYFEMINARKCPRLVLKNPANLTRIRGLLNAYPEARFIFVKRSPYSLFPSLLNYYRKEIDMFGYQNIPDETIKGNVLHWYAVYMNLFLETRKIIGSANLCEVRFEDIEQHPLRELERIYDHFGFRNFAECEPHAKRYLASVSGYRKNDFSLSAQDCSTVEAAWGFAFDELGYAKKARPDT